MKSSITFDGKAVLDLVRWARLKSTKPAKAWKSSRQFVLTREWAKHSFNQPDPYLQIEQCSSHSYLLLQ
ncbi:MAG: hypothetical protein PHW04_15655 [Candidatus Wallbacteria bacterium]|nr:hypothetical protein [Candidatus Wallbacteria bacterium]